MDCDDVIVLSDDSDESDKIRKTKLRVNNENKSKRSSDASDFSDLDFPEVSFVAREKENNLKTTDAKKTDNSNSDFLEVNFNNKDKFKNIEELEYSDSDFPELSFEKEYKLQQKEKEWSDSDFPEINFEKEKNLRVENKNESNNILKKINILLENESESDSDYESQNLPNNYAEYLAKEKANVNLSSDENEELVEKETKSKTKGKKRTAKPKKTDEEKKRLQEERQQLRLQKKEEAARQKALKRLNSKNRLNTNPEYSMRLMEVIFDDEIKKSDFYTGFLKAAEESDVKCNVESQLIPKSITWNRKVEENYINEKHEICSDLKTVYENQIMIIWDVEEVVKHISDDTLVSTISNIKSLVNNKKLSLVMYKIESYFKNLKNMKHRDMRDEILNGLGHETQKKSKTKVDKNFSHLAKISRRKFEESLVEIQLLYNVNSRSIETEEEMILLIHQYTKSLALLPSKMEKKQESSKVDWYVNCDNRDTVKVDKDGNGLKRLWQQQLCQFTLMSLETSEAISSIYKSPLQLMEAYTNCSSAGGEMLLRDIPIRRAAGPLTATRKIGPELSKKIYTMFTSEDGEIHLNE